jgi:Dolichyl-phosphate-mannose-protein mannosyltransferase
VPGSDYLAGLLFFAPTMACAAGGAWLLQVRRYGHLRGVERVVAVGMLAVLAVLAIHLAPLALGVLSRGTALATAVVFLAACLAVREAEPARSAEPPGPQGAGSAGPILATVPVVLTGLLALAIARDQLFLSPLAVDTLNFHLPGVAAWIQSGSLWQIDVFLPDVAPGHYPNNGDVLLLAAVLPWSNDFLSHLFLYPVFVLTGLATYALARELRAPPAAAAVGAALLLATPAVIVPALISGYPDVLALFGFATGLLFLVRHHRSGQTSELVLAGLSLGVAFGTKWYGVSTVAVVVAVWFVASLAARRPWRTVGRQALAVVGLIALAGGIWLVRNWVESGNPVFPVRVAPLEVEIFDAPRDVVREAGGFTLADYFDDPDVWREEILPQYRDVLALTGAVLVAGLVLAAAVLVRRRRQPDPERGLVLAGVLAGALILVAYTITPYSAGGPEGLPTLAGSDVRYAGGALVIGAALCAWAAARLPRGIAGFALLGTVAVVDAAVQISDSGRVGASVDRNDWLAALALAAALAILVWAVPRAWSRLAPRRRRPALAFAACLMLVAVAIAGYETQKRFNGVRYIDQDPTVDHILRGVPEGQRVGLAGTWDNGIPPVLPAFGPRLDNEVAYVGWNDGDFLRRFGDRASFVASLREGAYDYLFVGHGIVPEPSLREERWAKAAGFDEVVRSERLTLLRAPR